MFLVTKLMLLTLRATARPENVKCFLRHMQVVASQLLGLTFSPVSPGLLYYPFWFFIWTCNRFVVMMEAGKKSLGMIF